MDDLTLIVLPVVLVIIVSVMALTKITESHKESKDWISSCQMIGYDKYDISEWKEKCQKISDKGIILEEVYVNFK